MIILSNQLDEFAYDFGMVLYSARKKQIPVHITD